VVEFDDDVLVDQVALVDALLLVEQFAFDRSDRSFVGEEGERIAVAVIMVVVVIIVVIVVVVIMVIVMIVIVVVVIIIMIVVVIMVIVVVVMIMVVVVVIIIIVDLECDVATVALNGDIVRLVGVGDDRSLVG